MADNDFSLHVDTDWKKQAQEEKRKLAEEQAKKAAASAAAPAPSSGQAPRDPRGGPGAVKGRRERELPTASFATLINSFVTQVFYYLGEMGQGESNVNLDMAKYQLDTLGVLEAKTQGNLNDDERKLLDNALYETRTRFIGVATQYITF